MQNLYNYLFGPVPSRRLGRSLGIDLTPFKTCSMNCIFCQLGDSEGAIATRGRFVPVVDVLAELSRWHKIDGGADHITLAGSGEPTLHLDFGEVLRWVKENTAIPSVLLSNGSLFHLPEVRSAAALADKVKVTLSAWDETSFQQIHHPAMGVTFERLLAGERAFRRVYSGELSVEVFIIDGLNSDEASIRKLVDLVHSVEPDRIDLNTAIRPPADASVRAATPERLAELAKQFGPKASIAASFRKETAPTREVTATLLLGLIQRHPATATQLAVQFNVSTDAIVALLQPSLSDGTLHAEQRDGDRYFFYR